MNRQDAIRIAETAIVFDREFPNNGIGRMAHIVNDLDQIGSAITRMWVAETNGQVTEARADKYIRGKVAEAQHFVDELQPGVKVTQGSDPRGYGLHVYLPSGRSNSMGGEIWGF